MDRFAPCPMPFNLVQYVLGGGHDQPDKIALAVLSPARAERYSFARLEAAIRGTATGLLQAGLTQGDRILLRLGNTSDFPIAFLGAIAAGLVPVPSSALLTTPEISKLAALIRPKLILAHEGVPLPDPLPCPVLDNLAQLSDNPPAEYAMGDPNRLAYLVFTSGTSGRPRAVAHAHRAIWARRMMWQGWYGLTPEDRLLHAGAFNWTFTLGTGLLDPWSIGATALIPAQGTTPQMLPLLLKRHDATLFAAAPGVFRQILKAPLPALPKLRHGLSAGEKLPEHLREAWQEATGVTIHEAMGMSECSTFLSGCPDRPAPPHALGYAQEGRRLAVLGPDGAQVRQGESGLLAVHKTDPGLMLGYQEEDGFNLPLTGNWFTSGDLVQQDDSGAFFYHGRADDMLNAGGFRVSPQEIERAFAPLLPDCAAVSVEVKPGTFIIALAHTNEIAEPTLHQHAETCLAEYKRPRLYSHLAELPRGGNGKLNRKALVQLLKGQL